ncbi:MAG: TRAP transporter permease [Deltaproteobacteria bacterium]|nr:TRAP transporter permease [Deltaproteobacteria bacterium]MBM4325001.1 TRAP transporter permease [Deltaproteobacteria bacterium]
MAEEKVVDIKEVEKKLEEMHIRDIEVSGGRELTGVLSKAVFVVGLAMSLFHIYVLTIRAIDPWYFRTMHVVFAGVLIYAVIPGWKNAPKDRIHLIDYLFILLTIAPAAYIFIVFDEWIYRVGVVPTTLDFIFSTLFVITVVEMTRRTTGLPLAILSGIFILYGYFGNYMPGLFYHKGYSWPRMMTYLFSLDGILSLPVLSSAHYIFLFVLFGAFVEASGAGKFFVDFARCAAGRLRGGPAKVSIISSAIIGTASGSSVANVVVDGVFNIPLMKASGFRPSAAGAIEAMNSTGGQIMPPVMGAGAFLMAEILGVPYSKVALAAVIPALMYYTSAYWMIDFFSASEGLRGMKREELPVFRRIMMEKGYLLVPIVVLLISLMVLMYSPYRSALYAILSLIIVGWLRTSSRLGFKGIFQTLAKGARGSIEIAATCAAAGIIVGVLTQTGLGMKFAMIIINYSGGSLLVALIFTMLIAIILGMGMPTTAAYAISASVLAPALIQLKVPAIAAHLFIFYFACLSALTPPVALAAFAAAAIANAKTWNVGWLGMKFALAGFLIPYMFVYGPAMVLVGSPMEIAIAIISGLLGTLALGAAVQGWLLKSASWVERVLLLIGALCLIKPGWITDLIGFGLLIIVAGYQYTKYKKG